MTTTPIYDELYAKYVAGPSPREDVASVAGAVTAAQAVPFADAHQVPLWPSEG
ncbi:hypothetical protein [Lentzea sp. NPDC003310]|uniref:hypothetical protein n=1 Tax=Lentzea sp. NPDC003310 TaxID=3154447 RepID=UPI0033B4862B